ncbi:MAG: DUF3500 domain-containing protein [Planctomycetota bacterium]|nr:MAG: DUF3500 domain-containing protein [Planctomycetota bacterium]
MNENRKSATSNVCPDCRQVPATGTALDRRSFLKVTAVAASATAAGTAVAAKPTAKSSSETLVQQLYQTLTPRQKELCAFAFDHPLRQKVDNNWRITEARVGRDFSPEQQDLIRQIFLSLHSEEYAPKVLHQVEHDNGRGGLGACSIALFGEPGSGKFEFVFTGRHVTRRCDGDSVEGTAFGGPIFYGHAAQGFYEKPDHPGNVYWYQALRANKLFQALDGKQRKLALRGDPRAERGTETVKLRGKADELPGLPVAELTADQKELARAVLADLLAPFRPPDAQECLKLIEKNGFDKLHFSYFKNRDIGNDGVWDVWQIEGPAMVWYFRGAPHVHTWVHVRETA